MNSFTHTFAPVLLTLGLAFPATQILAQEVPSDQPLDLVNLTCWEVISAPEADATFVIAMLIGYKQGHSGTSVTSPKAISDAVTTLDEVCSENPDMSALSALD